MSDTTTQLLEALSNNHVDEAIKSIDFEPSEDSSKLLASVGNYGTSNLMALSLLLANNDIKNYSPAQAQKVISILDKLISVQINSILSNQKFKDLEAEWLKVEEVCNCDFDNVEVGIIDVSKEELQHDLESNLFDISSSETFKKVYVEEFDQYGGEPYGLILGLHNIDNNEDDITLLTGMGMVAKNSHAPYINSLNPSFFGLQKYEDISQIKNFESLMDHPRYKKWQDFRKTDESAYIGLTVGDFMLRSPYHNQNNPISHSLLTNFDETIDYNDNNDFRWGPSSIHLVKNAMRAYNVSGWFQYMRGVENGGQVRNLISTIYDKNGLQERKSPLNVTIPDYMELSLSKIGLIPFVAEKGTNNACFFSVQSMSKVETFVDDFDSANSALVSNLSYTMCISRISHYIKTVIRDKIGSIADKDSIKNNIEVWLRNYTTSVISPNSLTMARYPFRSTSIDVNNIPGKPGWFSCNIEVLPHIQFEGMDTTLKINSRLEPSLFSS
jgi:type VI secretion system protein ImpC